MNMQINPYQSVGGLPFGVNRTKSRQHFSASPKTYAMPEGRLPNDTYEEDGLTVIFDKYNVVGAIELTAPAEAIFQGKDLLKMPWSEAKEWFSQLDADLEEKEDGLVSFKYGITIFAPEKTTAPNQLPSSITAFRKNYFYIKNGIPDPKEISSFHMHVAFVEGITVQKEAFETVENAIEKVFINVREFGILMMNGMPIRFSYQHDLPYLLKDWAKMIDNINSNTSGTHELELNCPAFQTHWAIKWDEKFIEINTNWNRVDGAYEAVLNEEVSELFLLKKEFVAEWKMLFRQCHTAFQTAELKFLENEKEQSVLKQLNQLEKSIPTVGKFYLENEKVYTTDATGKRNVDLTKASNWQQSIIVALILIAVLVPVWSLSRGKDSVFWFLENMPSILLLLSPLLIIIFYAFYKERKISRSWTHPVEKEKQ